MLIGQTISLVPTSLTNPQIRYSHLLAPNTAADSSIIVSRFDFSTARDSSVDIRRLPVFVRLETASQ
jgi:hypothetical protein